MLPLYPNGSYLKVHPQRGDYLTSVNYICTATTTEVRAYTAIGPGPYSAPLDVQTLSDCK